MAANLPFAGRMRLKKLTVVQSRLRQLETNTVGFLGESMMGPVNQAVLVTN